MTQIHPEASMGFIVSDKEIESVLCMKLPFAETR